VNDTDLFWHLATGQRTLSLGLVRSDVFSWTIAGRPLLLDQWLGDVLIAVSYTLGGWRGILALRAIAVFGLVACTTGAALAAAPRRPLVAVLASLPAITLTRFVWNDRPELIGFAFFTALLVTLRDGRTRVLVATVPLLGIWANLHGSYALGLALTLVVCAERAFADPPRRGRLALIALAAAAATLLTPAGFATWTLSGGHFLAPPRYIQEEGVPDLRMPYGFVFGITLGLVIATAFLSRARGWREAVILVPIAFVSLTALRHMPFLAIAAAPYLASQAPQALAWLADALRIPSRRPSPPATVLPRMAAPVAAVAALAMVLAGVASAASAPDERGYPAAALASLPPGGGLLNSYDWGGWLIWSAPATPVFIDGRIFPYLPDVLDDYRAIVGVHADWQEVGARRGVRALLLRPTDAVAVRARELGWRVISASESYVLLARP